MRPLNGSILDPPAEYDQCVAAFRFDVALRTTRWQWCEGETLEQYMHGRTLAHVANLNSHWSEAEIADLEKAAIRLLWKEAEDARRAHHVSVCRQRGELAGAARPSFSE